MKVIALTFLIALFSTAAMAYESAGLSFHGTLTDAQGRQVNDTVEARFEIFDGESGGQSLWTEVQTGLDVVDGHFVARLGAQSPLGGIFGEAPRWIEITINGETLSPRTPVEAVPLAMRALEAGDAERVGGLTVEQLGSGPTTAEAVSYDSTWSDLQAANAQQAIDELSDSIGALQSRIAALESSAMQANTRLGNLEPQVSSLSDQVSILMNIPGVRIARAGANTEQGTLTSTNWVPIFTATSPHGNSGITIQAGDVVSVNVSAYFRPISANVIMSADLTPCYQRIGGSLDGFIHATGWTSVVSQTGSNNYQNASSSATYRNLPAGTYRFMLCARRSTFSQTNIAVGSPKMSAIAFPAGP